MKTQEECTHTTAEQDRESQVLTAFPIGDPDESEQAERHFGPEKASSAMIRPLAEWLSERTLSEKLVIVVLSHLSLSSVRDCLDPDMYDGDIYIDLVSTCEREVEEASDSLSEKDKLALEIARAFDNLCQYGGR